MFEKVWAFRKSFDTKGLVSMKKITLKKVGVYH